MKHTTISLSIFSLCCLGTISQAGSWVIDQQADWQKQRAEQKGVEIKDGMVYPTAEEATFKSAIKSFDKKQSATSLVFDQSPVWHNWEGVPNVGPVNCQDAPVVLCLGDKDYWMFGRSGGFGPKRKKGTPQEKKTAPFKPQAASLDGYDIPLVTTPDAHQFNAPGGLKPNLGGYHAWHSRDMVNWVHHGAITESFSRWMTSAEHKDGTFYFYYDYPNDQDPHVYVDKDLTDGVPGENKGIVLRDPSDGSDAGFFRDTDGRFHVIYENWDPINASTHAWDSPLAGHGVSPDGVSPFVIQDPAVDYRTTPTGKTATYKHPHWLQHPDWKSNIATYNVHTPEQEAYGDWAVIRVGGQYYLFADYDPVGEHMSVVWFTSSSIDTPFTKVGNIGKGHPDPDIGFAEGKFYLITQFKEDYVSPGPWVEEVKARAGVDTDNDGKIDQWTEWQEVKETYDHKPGFARVIDKTPASIDVSSLPAGFGFQFEFTMKDTTKNESKPIVDKVSMHFK
jgi:hypothetical protein